MRAYSHYIWDFDGTLFDSYPHSTAAMCATADRFGIPVEPAALSRWLHTSFATCVAALGLTEEPLRCFRALHGDLTFPPPIVPFPDTEAVLAELSRRGARHYLYTHSRRRMSVAFIERFGLARYFTDYMTPDDPGFAQKPDPGALRCLLAKHGIDPSTAAMVGDREIDMRSARAAAIDGILVDPEGLVGESVARWRTDRLTALLEDGEEPPRY